MVRPLTKRKKDGTLYVRPKAVETQIAAALREGGEALRRRLRIQERGSPEYLRTECLVHVVREASRNEDEQLLNAGVEGLLARCGRLLKTMVSGSLRDAEEIRASVLYRFSVLLARGVVNIAANELDYYECNFYGAFRALNRSVVRIELNKDERKAEVLGGDEIDGHGTDSLKWVTEALQNPEALVSRDELLDRLKQELLPDELNAVVLCRVWGLKEESDNLDEITAASLCNCTGRTIRNRLSRADAKLSRFEEGK